MIAGVDHKDCLHLRIAPSLPPFISSIISMHLYPFLPFCLPQECISMISFECIRDPDGLFLPIRKHPKLLLLHLHRLLVLPHLLLLLIKTPQKRSQACIICRCTMCTAGGPFSCHLIYIAVSEECQLKHLINHTDGQMFGNTNTQIIQ